MTRLIFSMLTAIALSTAPAGAVDRPNTPGKERAWDCSDWIREKPRICVSFVNNEEDEVGFWLEWTKNGEPQLPDFRAYLTDCIRHSAQPYRCEAWQWFGRGRGPFTEAFGDGEPQGFSVGKLDYETEYCFRFKARDTDGDVSEHWTAWACAKTREPPPLPPAPDAPKVTFYPGTPDINAPGEMTNDRLLVEWTARSPEDFRYVTAYTVIPAQGIADGHTTARTRADPALKGPHRAIIDLPTHGAKPYEMGYSVCAENISGKACSNTGYNFVTAVSGVGAVRMTPDNPAVRPQQTLGKRGLPAGRRAIGDLATALEVGGFRSQADVAAMPLDGQRNTLITELAGRTRSGGPFYQGLNNADLAGAGAVLVYLRASRSRTDEQIKTLTLDDMRNIAIVEIAAKTGRGRDLQGLSNLALIGLVGIPAPAPPVEASPPAGDPPPAQPNGP